MYFIPVLIIHGAVLWGLLLWLGDKQEVSFSTSVGTALLCGVFATASGRLFEPYLGAFSIAPAMLAPPLMVWLVCDVSFGRSMLIGVLYALYMLGFVLTMIFVLA
jgi:hypothetical protein